MAACWNCSFPCWARCWRTSVLANLRCHCSDNAYFPRSLKKRLANLWTLCTLSSSLDFAWKQMYPASSMHFENQKIYYWVRRMRVFCLCILSSLAYWDMKVLFCWQFSWVPEILCISSDPSLCSSVGDSPVHGFAPQLSQRFPVWRAVSGHVFAPASTECTLYSMPKYDGCQKECGPFSLFSQENDTWGCSMGL